MAGEHSSGGAIAAALAANLGIAVTKAVAFALTGSSSMLAESIHSVVDSGNQVLLLVGGRRAQRAADAAHPFGYGRRRYVYAFGVSVMLFTLGGVVGIYEGVEKWQHPEPLEHWRWVPIAVLLVSIALEGFSFHTAWARRELLVAAEIAVPGADTAAQVASAIDAAERRVRQAVPIATLIYLEPDLRRT